MSSLIIDKFAIEKLEPHFNADRLDVATISGWQVVVSKNKYKQGDEVIYIPVQTILSEELNDKVFPPDSKIKLGKDRRIKTISLRKQISQGMTLDPKEFDLEYVRANCTKWQSPAESLPNHMKVNVSKKPKPDIKAFVKYTDMEHGKYYDRCLQDGETVYITQKLHGTSARYGWHKTEANVWYLKLLKFLRLLPKDTFCYGSRNVQLQYRLSKKNYYEGDVYGKIAKEYELKERIPKGYALYGEIVGDGIQKGWNYGCETGQHVFYVYDVRDTVNERWLNCDEMFAFCDEYRFQTVPLHYKGPYNSQLIKDYLDMNTLSDEINEGVVIKPEVNRTGPMGRFVLKYISDAYYLRNEAIDGTDFQ